MWYFSYVFFFKQKTAYEMCISDWSSDVCSSDLPGVWQKLRTVAYACKLNYDGQPTWPQRTVPGRHLNHMKEYFYQSGNKFFFNCYGGMNALINLAYFEFPRRLVYQAVDSRLVTWDEEEYIFEYDPSLVPDEEIGRASCRER